MMTTPTQTAVNPPYNNPIKEYLAPSRIASMALLPLLLLRSCPSSSVSTSENEATRKITTSCRNTAIVHACMAYFTQICGKSKWSGWLSHSWIARMRTARNSTLSMGA